MTGKEAFDRFRKTMQLMMMPRFHFNSQLYHELIREREQAALKAPQDEPEVEFTNGELPEGIAGIFNPREMDIKIDALNIFLTCQKANSREEMEQIFDDRLTETLAHEGGHWRLEKRHGYWLFAEKIFYQVASFLLGFILIMFLMANFNQFIFGSVAAAISTFGIFGLLISLGLGFFWLWATVKVFGRLAHVLFFVSWAISYQLCYTERYARNYAKSAQQDGRWKNVIVVDE